MPNTIAYLLPSPDFFSDGQGGAVSHAIGVANGLASNGDHVWLFAESGVARYHNEFHENVEIVEVRCENKGFASEIRFVKQIVNRLLNKVRHEGCPVAVLMRKTFWSLPYIGVLQRSIGDDAVIVAEVNGLSYNMSSPLLEKTRLNRLLVLINKRFLRLADTVYCVSASLQNELTNGVLKIASNAVEVIPNGGPPPCHLPQGVEYIPGSSTDSVRFVYFGKFQPYNNFEAVFDAFERHRSDGYSSELAFVGFGKEEEFIKRRASATNCCHVYGPMSLRSTIRKGIITKNTYGLIPLYNNIVAEYLSPIKLYDYFSAGCPVVYSDVGCLKEMVGAGGFGKMYAPDKAASLAMTMNECCEEFECLPDYRRKVQAAYEGHTWERRMADLRTAIKENTT